MPVTGFFDPPAAGRYALRRVHVAALDGCHVLGVEACRLRRLLVDVGCFS